MSGSVCKRWISAVALSLSAGLIGCSHEAKPGPGGIAAEPVGPPLVTGRSIEPKPESVQGVGSIPINMIASPDGKFVVTTDEGFRQQLWSTRVSDGAGVSKLNFAAEPPDAPGYGLYYGLAFGANGTLYAAQGANDSIAVLHLDDQGKLSRQGVIRTKIGDFPSGLSTDARGRLYVANNDTIAAKEQGYKLPGTIAIYDTADGKEIGRFEFSDSFGGTPNFPLAIAALSEGGKVYVASQRDGAVYVLDVADPAHAKLVDRVETGAHPVSLLLDKSQEQLFVANAQSDTVSVINTKTNQIISTILLRPEIARGLPGCTPNGLALSPDQKRLYVTLGDMNAVGVIDADSYALLGYIPAGWYPTAVVVAPDGQRLLVTNAKGTVARLPNPTTRPGARKVSPIALLEGNVIGVAVPTGDELAESTERALELARLTPRHMPAHNPLGSIGLQAGKITHVIYIVKENRTYDQVLGDLPQANGDPSRCLFGRQVTPNLHALAERFVLLDNFYDCGEVSGDGWTWSTQAQANEYAARNVPYSYSSRGRSYDYEGQVENYPTGGFPAVDPDGKPLSQQFKNGAPRVPDVSEAGGGHIWDMARKCGLSYRNFGFFLSDGVYDKKKTTLIPDNYPNSTGLQPPGHDLAGVTDIDFRRFDLNYPDSEGPKTLAEQNHDPGFLRPMHGYGKYDEPSRYSEWKREFDQMLAKAADGSAVPAFMTVRFCTDHTMGTNPNRHTPKSMVADNDFAVGQLVEAVSHSPIWKSTAIFVIEDDAQDGPDHVDAHRSICFVISPWIKAHSIDHTFQNTVSLIRTMELLLGMPPMCQYDGTADPIMDWDAAPSNDGPYQAILPDAKILREVNGARNPRSPISPEQRTMMDESSRMDFAHADAAPAARLNEIIWKSVKGYESNMPPTPHGPPPLRTRAGQDEDD